VWWVRKTITSVNSRAQFFLVACTHKATHMMEIQI
jgi:hypothetical protein